MTPRLLRELAQLWHAEAYHRVEYAETHRLFREAEAMEREADATDDTDVFNRLRESAG